MLRGSVPAVWLALFHAWAQAQSISPARPEAGRPAAACSTGSPASSSPASLLLACFPGLVTEPLDLNGLHFARRPLVSALGLSWTATRFRAADGDLTDPYQPGQAWALYPPAVTEIRVVPGLDRTTASVLAAEIQFLPPETGPAWRGRLNLSGTAAALAGSNLPPPAARGLLRQPERFQWLTGNDVRASGPISSRAFLSGAAGAYWASQTVPQAPPGRDLRSRVLSSTAHLSADLTTQDRIGVSGLSSRYHLSDFGLPPGVPGLPARRMSPDYFLPTWGFAGLAQSDQFDALRGAWRRASARQSWEAACHLSRTSAAGTGAAQSGAIPQLDLTAGVLGDVPPLAGEANRSRTECAFSLDFHPAIPATSRHRLKLGGSWVRNSIRERPQVPEGRHLIYADSEPAFVVDFVPTTPSPQRLSGYSAWVQDSVRLAPPLQVELTIHADIQRANLTRVPRSQIAWNRLSPRLAAAFTPFSRLTLRAAYAVLPSPIAGRCLDYADPGSLSGAQSFWADSNGDRQWQPMETGTAVFRFGGLYSSLDPELRAPVIRETSIAVQASLPVGLQGSVQLFRQDLTRRLAVLNIGLGPGAFGLVQVADPGPDGLPGSRDDQMLNLYAQNPATFATDRYLLSNAEGLDMATQGVLAQLQYGRPVLSWWLSFLAVKALGPTSPGNSAFENDPGVLGSLLMDPNSTVHAAGRTFFDRAYVGKAAVAWNPPLRRAGLSLASSAVYLDGLAFGRRLLVRGLPQGPFLAAATVRGSPEGGHRTQYVLHWSVRLSRPVSRGRFTLRPSVDILNVLNRGHRLREIDLTSPRFLERLPVAIQPPRSLRLTMEITY